MKARGRHEQLEFDLGETPPEAEVEDTDALLPDPNYLSRFRRAMGDEGIVTDEEFAAFEAAVIAFLHEVQKDQST